MFIIRQKIMISAYVIQPERIWIEIQGLMQSHSRPILPRSRKIYSPLKSLWQLNNNTLKTENTKIVVWIYLYSKMRADWRCLSFWCYLKHFWRPVCVKGCYKQMFSASKYPYSLSFFRLERGRWSGPEQSVWLFLDCMVILESLATYILV